MSEAQLFVATTFTEIYERVLVGPLFRPFARATDCARQPESRRQRYRRRMWHRDCRSRGTRAPWTRGADCRR